MMREVIPLTYSVILVVRALDHGIFEGNFFTILLGVICTHFMAVLLRSVFNPQHHKKPMSK